MFVASRVAGILAHANEERQTMSAMRRIDPVNHVYRGPPRRDHRAAAARELQESSG